MLIDYNKRHFRLVTVVMVMWMLLFVSVGAGIGLVLKRLLCCAPTADQLYGCTVKQQKPNGDCP